LSTYSKKELIDSNIQLTRELFNQKRQLDFGIQQILQTHVRAANGDYTARAPLEQDNILWQVASSLNNLLSRLQRSGQAERRLNRTNEGIRRLAAAIYDAQAGREPTWPAPTGTAADLILEQFAPTRRLGYPTAPSDPWGHDDWAQSTPQTAAGWQGQAQPSPRMPTSRIARRPSRGIQPLQGLEHDDGWPAPADSPLGAPATRPQNPLAKPDDDH
jgi:hypothetical protein